MHFLPRETRAHIPRFDHGPGLSHDEAMLEDIRITILSGTYIDDTIDDEDLPLPGRIAMITEHETPQ